MLSLLRPFAYIQALAARIPAMFFLVFYVAMIPSFAVYYYSVAEDFFHSTVKYEAHILGDDSQVREELTQVVREKFTEANAGHTKKVSGWLVDIREFTIIEASFEEGKLYFRAYMRFNSDDGREIGGPRVFYVDAEPSFVVAAPDSQNRRVIKIPASDQKSYWPVDDSHIFQLSSIGFVTAERGALALPVELQDRITSLKNSYDGFPARSTGTFGRLLYFSAVTQTTLGFGDIVPISDRTRLAVGFQSVLGIVFIGLFLNSLAQPLSSKL